MTSKLFGSRSRFAVEINYDLSASNPTVVAGYFSYWISDHQIGDGNYYHLTAQFGSMGWVRRDCGHREGGTLCKLSPAEILQWWRSVIFGEPLPVFEGVRFPEDFARFDIMFNFGVASEPILLIACQNRGRLIWRPGENLPPIVLEDEIEQFEGPIKDSYAFMDWLHDEVGFVGS